MSKEIEFIDSGLSEFEDLIKEYAEKVSDDKALDAVEVGAEEFVKDLLRLPKPRSQINKPGYTHIVNTFAVERTDKSVKVGWGKYYGQCLSMEPGRWHQEHI